MSGFVVERFVRGVALEGVVTGGSSGGPVGSIPPDA